MPDHDSPTIGDATPRGAREPASPGAPASLTDRTQPLPAAIGRYRILRLLGEGGMGAVYEAEQEFPQRTVALKVIRAGYATIDMLRRFENEAQALARLQHPGIAQIYDAGTAETPFGRQPYFAMELVHGRTLLADCDEHQLNGRQRLDLMAKICDAVHHAHQRGLIHRDLKPANILVDESGQPRILDFGVARLTDSDAQATRQTDIGQLIGTLAYMSPEQVLGDPAEVDTRSDVYTLGVILYELLASKPPYAIGRQLTEAVRTIREEEPTALGSVNRSYRGDVETIVGKALEKDKAQRYASAAELAADIRRHLRDEPIMARPPSASYQLQKFARRNKALVTGVSAVFVVLVAGVIASSWEAVQARRAEANARQESAIAQAVNDFLRNDVLAQASAAAQSASRAKPDPDLKVRTALDLAAARIGGKFQGQPEVEASIRDTMGQTYEELGLYTEAQTQFERELDLERRALGKTNPKTLKTMSHLGDAILFQGKFQEAEELLSGTLETQRQVLGSDDRDTLYTMADLALAFEDHGKYAEAETLLSQTLEIQRRVLGPEHPDTLRSMNGLAFDYQKLGKYAQAEALYAQTLEIRRRVLGPEHPDTLVSMINVGDADWALGKYTEAEAPLSQALAISKRVLGAEHPQTLWCATDLANVYRDNSEYARAEALFNPTVEIAKRVLGPEHPDTLKFISYFALAYQREGKYALAQTYGAQALAGYRHALRPETPNTVAALCALALAYVSQKKFVESEPLAREALEAAQKTQPDDWQRFRAETLLGESLAGQKKYGEAEPLMVEGYNGMEARQDRRPALDRYHLDLARNWISQMYQLWGKPEKAAQWMGIKN